MAVLTLENLIVPPTSQILAPGTPAPEFALPCGPDETCRLRDLRGSNVILAFYPADWSPVCGDQTSLYNEVLEDFEALDAKLLGISVDSLWCHQAYAQHRKLRFPLLADFEPKGEVARRYGVYDAANGTSERALFVIDKAGVVHWSYLSPADINPGADGILAALESLATGPAAAGAAAGAGAAASAAAGR
jgi:peroxiredoxin